MRTTESTESAQSTSKYASTISLRAGVTSDSSYPTLSTRRFRFRPFALTDIGPLATLAGEHRVADTSIGIPHPYTMNLRGCGYHRTQPRGRFGGLCIGQLRDGDDQIVGYAGLNNIDTERRQAELRFWVGCGVERRSDAVEWSN